MTPQQPAGARRTVFAFGSNRLGVHGAGAALCARREHGAIMGRGEGLQGNSYAIPTKAAPYSTLPLEEVAKHIERFKAFAREHQDLDFNVTAIGTGRAGFSVGEIGPLFADAPDNCLLCTEFQPYRAKAAADVSAAA